MSLTYAVIALARPTFDVEFAEQMKDRAFAALDLAGIRTIGPRSLAFDADAAECALGEIEEAGDFDLLLIMQVTFTDATMTVQLAKRSSVRIVLWGFPEPRAGGRLRLNAYCGINLGVHALGKADRPCGWLYAAPDSSEIGTQLRALVEVQPLPDVSAKQVERVDSADADRVVTALDGARISVIGKHPEGFDTCEYDEDVLQKLAGVDVNQVPLEEAFARAEAADERRVAAHRQSAEKYLEGLAEVDQEQLGRSFRLLCALEDIAAEQKASSIAVRCWPETFTEYGCAACGPMAMMNEAGVPSACEADVYGSLTTLMLQELAGEPVWMADLVDVDSSDDTAVLWHCGLAPISMCDPEVSAKATVHTNRKMPLLHQFPLKPGRVTLARISQAGNRPKLMLAGAEVQRAPMAFTGTSGVIRFDRPAGEVHERIMAGGLEHHFSLAYGEHRPTLRQVASRLQLPVLELT